MNLAIVEDYVAQYITELANFNFGTLEVAREEPTKPTGGNLVAEISLNGSIFGYRANYFVEELRYYANRDDYGAILITMNGPGGEVEPASRIYGELIGIEKPVYVHSNMLLSAHYLMALGANRIYASNEMSRFGSIGIVMTYSPELIEYLKERFRTIYSDLSPDKNMIERALREGNEEPAKAEANRQAEMFRNLVKKERKLKGDQDSSLTGKIFDANQAMARGLVDGVRSYGSVLNMLREKIKSV